MQNVCNTNSLQGHSEYSKVRNFFLFWFSICGPASGPDYACGLWSVDLQVTT